MKALFKKGQQFRVVMVDSEWKPGLPLERYTAAGLYASSDALAALAELDPVARPRQKRPANVSRETFSDLTAVRELEDYQGKPRRFRDFTEFSRVIS